MKTLGKILGRIGTTVGAGVLLTTTSCATLPKRDFPENHISGIKYSAIDETDFPYSLEEQVIYGDKQYFQKRDVTNNTLAIEILRDEDVIREMDVYSGKTKLTSHNRYIPTRVESATPGTKDNWVDGVVLTDVYADLTPEKESEKDAANKYGYRTITTQEGSNFSIMTLIINGIEYFFPRVAEDKVKDGKLDYYLIPVKGTTIRVYKDDLINNKAYIELRNENEIYRPILEESQEQEEASPQKTEILN